MKTFAILAVGMLSAPLTAFAGGLATPVAEPYVESPVVITQTRADGDWGGFYVGGQLGYANVTSNDTAVDGNGVLGGVHAGYRYDLGTLVLGGEIDYNFANIELGTGEFDNSLDSLAHLKLMAGLDLGRAMVYATGGAAYADGSADGTSASGNGYFAGIGMDYALTEKMNLGAELLGHRFDDFDDRGVDAEIVTLQAKVAYRF